MESIPSHLRKWLKDQVQGDKETRNLRDEFLRKFQSWSILSRKVAKKLRSGEWDEESATEKLDQAKEKAKALTLGFAANLWQKVKAIDPSAPRRLIKSLIVIATGKEEDDDDIEDLNAFLEGPLNIEIGKVDQPDQVVIDVRDKVEPTLSTAPIVFAPILSVAAN